MKKLIPKYQDGNLIHTAKPSQYDFQVTAEAPTVYWDGFNWIGFNDLGQRVTKGSNFNPSGARIIENPQEFENARLTQARRKDINGTHRFAEKVRDVATLATMAPMAGPLVEAAPTAMPWVKGAMELGVRPTSTIVRGLSSYIPQVSKAIPYFTGLDKTAMGMAGLFGMKDAYEGYKSGDKHWANALAEGTLDALMLGEVANPVLKNTLYPIANKAVDMWNTNPIFLYPRYAIGKFKYGFDVELPTVYRKLKEDVVPTVDANGEMSFTNTPSRFRYEATGEDPLITNFTTDVPVRSHGQGNWDTGNVYAFSGKNLLGHKVVSTRPSDTFTVGKEVKMPAKDVTLISGKPSVINLAKLNGYNVFTSENLMNEAQAAEQAALNASTGRFNFTKDKDFYRNYSKALQNATRQKYKAPSLKDYLFMDYVFKPTYKSLVEPLSNLDLYMNQGGENMPAWFGKMIGNASARNALEDLDNILYHPSSSVEAEWRNNNGVKLLKDIPFNTRKSWPVNTENITTKGNLSTDVSQITAENAASITPEQWTAAQDAAIARGDMAEAQRLRDLHSALVPSATPGKYYRGTQTKRTSYPDRHIDEEVGEMNGIYMTKNPKYAKTYGDVEEFYLHSNNSLNTEGSWTGVIDDATRTKIENSGYDAIVNNRFDTGFLNKLLRNSRDETITFNGKNIKSADAVTYDDNGVRIPLGKRDNFNINDIRYGLLPWLLGGAGYLYNNKKASNSL